MKMEHAASRLDSARLVWLDSTLLAFKHCRGCHCKYATESLPRHCESDWTGLDSTRLCWSVRTLTSLELIEWRMRRVMWLQQTPTVFWVARGNIFLSYSMYKGLINWGRQKYEQQSHWCLSLEPLRLRWQLKSWKVTNHQVLTTTQQKWLKQEVDKLAVRSIN